jgi:DNA topoisomerase-1
LTGRTLVICEKPTAARRIAHALDEDAAPQSFTERGVPYFIAKRGEEDLIVVSALGHLFTVAQEGGGWTYPVFSMRWVPAYEADKRLSRTKGFIDVIGRLASGVDGYVSACDYDMEGSLIAYMILLNVCREESLNLSRRMRYSTLTDRDLERAWEEMSDHLDFQLIEAGKARHEVDWLFGINLTRALTLSVKNATGFYRTLSIGRVQGPTLKLIRDREVEIRSFVPTPFWVIKADTMIEERTYPLAFSKPRLETREEAESVESSCRSKDGVVKAIRTTRQEQPPFSPFNLGDLQREAYNKLRYPPRTTLTAAEMLYLDALISYPRTSNQRLPPSIDLRQILEGLRRKKEYAELAGMLLSKPRLTPKQGKKDDPAHPAIHPTGGVPGRLGRVEGRIFDLICRRFMAALGDTAFRENAEVDVDVNGHRFSLRGSRILERGWMTFYEPYVEEREIEFPPLTEGQTILIKRVESIERYTRPRPRYNPSSLLKLMEDEAIGTKTTRTDIIDTFYKRGYVENREIELTDLGFAMVETLSRYNPEILSVEMTRGLEQDLESIQTGRASAEDVVEEAVKVLRPVLAEFRSKESEIGAELDEALRRMAQRAVVLGPCPGCGDGEIRVIRNKNTGKRFAGCSNFFEGKCDVSYPLPQRGSVRATGKSCPSCGAPIIRVIRRGRRPWELCVNFDCPAKEK